jgi:hypothetical protein
METTAGALCLRKVQEHDDRVANKRKRQPSDDRRNRAELGAQHHREGHDNRTSRPRTPFEQDEHGLAVDGPTPMVPTANAASTSRAPPLPNRPDDILPAPTSRAIVEDSAPLDLDRHPRRGQRQCNNQGRDPHQRKEPRLWSTIDNPDSVAGQPRYGHCEKCREHDNHPHNLAANGIGDDRL